MKVKILKLLLFFSFPFLSFLLSFFLRLIGHFCSTHVCWHSYITNAVQGYGGCAVLGDFVLPLTSYAVSALCIFFTIHGYSRLLWPAIRICSFYIPSLVRLLCLQAPLSLIIKLIIKCFTL